MMIVEPKIHRAVGERRVLVGAVTSEWNDRCRGIVPAATKFDRECSDQYQLTACEWPQAEHGVPYAREM